MTITIPEELRAKFEAKAKRFGFASVDEYVVDLVEHDEVYEIPDGNSKLSFRTREELEALLLEGVNSGPPVVVDRAFWEERRRILEEKIAARKLVATS